MQVLNVHGVNDVRMDPIDPPRPGADDVVVRKRALEAIGVAGTPGSAKVMVEFDGGVAA